MKKLKIFLASSSELAEDRKEVEILIGRENKALSEKKLFIELIIWEDFIDAMSRNRLQKEYNDAVKACDIFLLLFFTKVGKYTREEFETAFGQFQDTNKPLIFTYFRNSEIKIGNLVRNHMLSLWEFQDRLRELGHFQTVYKDINDFKYQFKNQLSKYIDTIRDEKNDLSEIGNDIIGTIVSKNEENEKVILELLDDKDPRTKAFLIDESGFSKNKINRIVNRLVKKDLIYRVLNKGTDFWIKKEQNRT